MRKLFAIFALAAACSLNMGTAQASEVTNLQKGEMIFEIGTSPNAKVSGKLNGTDLEAKGKRGFKSTFTYAIDDKWDFQYRKTMFDSEEASASVHMGGQTLGLTTTASVDLNDYNLRYKINDRHKLVVGLENSRMNYDNYVKSASHTTAHIGFDSEYKVGHKSYLFTKHVWGHKTSDQEYGVLFDLSDRETLSISYINRKSTLPVTLFTKEALMGAGYSAAQAGYAANKMGEEYSMNDTEYKMTGISIMYGVKL